MKTHLNKKKRKAEKRREKKQKHTNKQRSNASSSPSFVRRLSRQHPKEDDAGAPNVALLIVSDRFVLVLRRSLTALEVLWLLLLLLLYKKLPLLPFLLLFLLSFRSRSLRLVMSSAFLLSDSLPRHFRRHTERRAADAVKGPSFDKGKGEAEVGDRREKGKERGPIGVVEALPRGDGRPKTAEPPFFQQRRCFAVEKENVLRLYIAGRKKEGKKKGKERKFKQKK